MKRLFWPAMIFTITVIAASQFATAEEPKTAEPTPAKCGCGGVNEELKTNSNLQVSVLTNYSIICPQYPVYQMQQDPEVNIYYSYRYAVDGTETECPEPSVDYLVGLYDWPMDCFDDCQGASSLRSGLRPTRFIFPGLNETVTLSHELSPSDRFDVHFYENKFPAGIPRASYRVVDLPEDETFLRYRPDGSAGTIYFKRFGIDPATKIPDEKDHFFVAFQLDDFDGRKIAGLTIPVTNAKSLEGEKAFSGVAAGKKILLLLAK